MNLIADTNARFLLKTTGILPWLYSIGDTIGLFPIVYADRLAYAQSRGTGTIYFIFILQFYKDDYIYTYWTYCLGNHSAEEDLYIVSEVVDK